jgi:hypothetical protein
LPIPTIHQHKQRSLEERSGVARDAARVRFSTAISKWLIVVPGAERRTVIFARMTLLLG